MNKIDSSFSRFFLFQLIWFFFFCKDLSLMFLIFLHYNNNHLSPNKLELTIRNRDMSRIFFIRGRFHQKLSSLLDYFWCSPLWHPWELFSSGAETYYFEYHQGQKYTISNITRGIFRLIEGGGGICQGDTPLNLEKWTGIVDLPIKLSIVYSRIRFGLVNSFNM